MCITHGIINQSNNIISYSESFSFRQTEGLKPSQSNSKISHCNLSHADKYHIKRWETSCISIIYKLNYAPMCSTLFGEIKQIKNYGDKNQSIRQIDETIIRMLKALHTVHTN